jgi:mono/diheme cytochrome c family protein
MKNFLLGALAAIVLLAIATFTYLGLGFASINSDAKPPEWEARLMYRAIHASVRRSAPNLQSPLPATDETVIAGGKLYLSDCVGCHGAPGQPPSDFGATFYPPAPQFPVVGTQYSPAEVFWIAKHGIRHTGMYPQGSSYKEESLWRLAAFITNANHLSPGVSQALQPKPAK